MANTALDPAPDTAVPEQLALLPAPARVRRALAAARASSPPGTPSGTAAQLPVARVLVDVPLAHLDRPFDYLVPAAMHERVQSGSRVKVRFAGQDVDGFVLDRVARSEHDGPLAPLRRAVSAEPVLTPAVARLCAAVAERYAGTRSDVLRLAVPPRHAATEKAARQDPTEEVDRPGEPVEPAALPRSSGVPSQATTAWSPYRGGPALLASLAAGDAAPTGAAPRAVWTALPGEQWAARLAEAAAATFAGGRGAVLCVPDSRDLAVLDEALREVLGEGRHVALSAELGPAARYAAFLAVSRGQVRVVAGTRAAAFAPVHDLGLVATWDDGDDLHAEPRAPYPHVREVLLLRAQQTGCAVLLGAHARSVEAAALLRSGWAQEVAAERPVVRERAPRVVIPGASDRDLERDPGARSARLPSAVHEVVRTALESGPVLVQAPRAGYVPVLACERCRHPVRCTRCAGPLRLAGRDGPPSCGWCGRSGPEATGGSAWACPECGHHGFRAPVVGEQRTAEELGRAFPRVPVRRSSGERVLPEVPMQPAVVVATPGAEPRVAGGYAAAVLLDTWLVLARPDLRSAEEAFRRWTNAAALVRPAAQGGRVVAVGDPAHPALQALVRWDPGGLAEREAEERVSAHLPPASRVAVVSGEREAVLATVAALDLPAGAEVLGPVAVVDRSPPATPRPDAQALLVEDDPVRLVLRVPRRAGPVLSRTLREVQGLRSARKLAPVRVQVDPLELG